MVDMRSATRLPLLLLVPRAVRRVSLGACLLIVACSLHRAPQASSAHAPGVVRDGGATSYDASAGGKGGVGVGVGAAGAGGHAGGNANDASVGDAGSGAGGGSADGAIDAGPVGYEPGAVGAPCTVDSQCWANGRMSTCFSESYFAPLLTLPKGYCGKLCDLTAPAPCETGAVCITIPTFPPVPVCMRQCTRDHDCREQDGYSCNKPFTSTSSVCSLRN